MHHGGQGGFAICIENQHAMLSNSAIVSFENAGEIGAATNRIRLAALWLHQHRATLTRPVIPALRERFQLTNLEAIEATKQAHALAYPKA